MSVTQSNTLGVYVLKGSTSTDALTVVTGATGTLADGDFTGLANGTYLWVANDGSAAIVADWDGATASDSNMDLAGCATNTTLDINNSINETVCRDGSGSSTRHIVSGATTWSVSVDGLFGAFAATETDAADLVTIANGKYYVVVKFDTGSTSYIGQALVESVNISGGVDDIATYSCSLNGQGILYVDGGTIA